LGTPGPTKPSQQGQHHSENIGWKITSAARAFKPKIGLAFQDFERGIIASEID
jgi:hypothetical protein